MPLFDFSKDPRANVKGIRRRVLKMIMEASKSTLPNEFAAMMKSNDKGVIHELMLLPGTEAGESSAIFKLHMLPIDFSVVGTVHSHPSDSSRPSGADLDLFRRYGWLHIITHYPFDMDCWSCYDGRGEPHHLEVLD